MIAQISSGFLCTVPALGALAGEALWLITPHSNGAKLAGRSMIIRIYGALCCLPKMNVIDGCQGVVMMATIIVCSWIFGSPIAALLQVLCASAAGPWIMLVGLEIALLPPLGGVDATTGYVFGAFGAIFGLNVVWRCLSPEFAVPAQFVPVVAAWHTLCMMIYAHYASHFLKVLPNLKHTIKLEKLKDEFITEGGTWTADGKAPSVVDFPTMPHGFKPDAALVAAAEKEQEAVLWQPLPLFLLDNLVILGGLVAALATASTFDGVGDSARSWIFLPLVTSLVGAGFLMYATSKAINGGMGTKAVTDLL